MNCSVCKDPATHIRTSHHGVGKTRIRRQAFCDRCVAAVRRFGTKSHLLERIVA